MLIVCPNCGTSYRVTRESLGEAGRSVRCVGCHQIWFEEARSPSALPAFAAGLDTIAASLIRPPLNDVVDIGAVEPASTVSAAADLHPDIEFATEYLTETPQPRDAPSIVPPGEPVQHRPAIDAPRNVERAAVTPTGKRLPPRRTLRLSRHALPAALCALALALFCVVAARQQVVRFLPQTASLYARIGLPVNLRGLAFANIKTAREMQDGVPMLTVEGDIVGTTGRHTEVPRLRIAVTDGSGKEIYAWTARPSRTLLPPGETLPFRARLASPPADASGISVRFFNRRDAQAGFM
jgi:predicted Zn finger-like uncharacterized protein